MPRLKWFQRNLVIKPSLIPNGGLGLFAKCDIPIGTRLGWYRGDIITEEEWKKTLNDCYVWMLVDEDGKEYYVDAYMTKRNNKLRYVNGALTASQKALVNVESYQKNNKIWYKTIKRIPKGVEIIIDYGEDFFNPVEVG